ncbi:MAG TPA: 50S ribosomal protein L18 [Candidatus Saccharimonadales bacterium]
MERNRTIANRALRKTRVRNRIRGTADKPRLTLSISSRHVSAQLIDDTSSHTLAASSTVGQKNLDANLTARAKWVGADIAKKAKKASIVRIVFDRGDKKYHGRAAALAEAVRAEGIKF